MVAHVGRSRKDECTWGWGGVGGGDACALLLALCTVDVTKAPNVARARTVCSTHLRAIRSSCRVDKGCSTPPPEAPSFALVATTCSLKSRRESRVEDCRAGNAA